MAADYGQDFVPDQNNPDHKDDYDDYDDYDDNDNNYNNDDKMIMMIIKRDNENDHRTLAITIAAHSED